MHRDVSGWTTRLDQQMIDRFVAGGRWANQTLIDRVSDRLRTGADSTAVIDGDVRLTFAELYDRARRLAAALAGRGLSPGDVISFQLPNWHETFIINLAASLGGFVCNPIVPIYRDAEVGFILNDARAKILFVPSRFRSIDYIAMIEKLRSALPDLADVIVVRGEHADHVSFDALLANEGAPLDHVSADPNAIKLLLYTSGTTGKPKGVLHSHNTLGAEIDAVMEFWRVSSDDVILMPSPVTHITGYLYALELPFASGAKAVLMDSWKAEEAVRLIDGLGVTLTVGATPFLVELVAAAESEQTRLPSLRMFACGGAPVAPDLILHAHSALENCIACRIYGSSEAPTVSLGITPDETPERGARTDGFIVNHEVRVVDIVSGEVVKSGREGEIVTRGPELLLGYTDPAATAAAFDADGFFHTGDLGHVSRDGFVTISGRAKDIIIRGGENISPKEIEDVLHQHPAILEAAVVAMPHSRMGETPMCYLVLRPGSCITLAEVVEFLNAQGLARQKFPEALEVLQELPRTASGKVLKHVLRARSDRGAGTGSRMQNATG